MNPTISRHAGLTATSATQTHAPDDGARTSRTANYVMDVVFIALLAAPFLIFEAPASVREALVTPAAAVAPAVQLSAFSPASSSAPADVYGPE